MFAAPLHSVQLVRHTLLLAIHCCKEGVSARRLPRALSGRNKGLAAEAVRIGPQIENSAPENRKFELRTVRAWQFLLHFRVSDSAYPHYMSCPLPHCLVGQSGHRTALSLDFREISRVPPGARASPACHGLNPPKNRVENCTQPVTVQPCCTCDRSYCGACARGAAGRQPLKEALGMAVFNAVCVAAKDELT